MLSLASGLALALAASMAPGAALAEDGEAQPGQYVIFRTHTATTDPTPEQVAGCVDHFGEERATLSIKQAAQSYAPSMDLTSGLAVDETASYLGPAFICATLGPSQDVVDAYGNVELPMGKAHARGTCEAAAAEVVRAAPFLGCRMALDPMPGIGSPGGYTVGNSVSGSLFAAFVVRDPSRPLPYEPPPAEPAHGSLPNDPDFYIWRTAAAAADDAACPQGAGAGVRTASLAPVQPELATALLPAAQAGPVGSVTLCFAAGDADRRTVTAVAEIPRAGQVMTAHAEGDCRVVPVPGGARADLLVQTCTLSVLWADSPLFRAGQFTSIGLVRADRPLEAVDSHVWTLGILDGDTEGGPVGGLAR